MEEKIKLRDKLVDIALQWQASFGVAPSITSSISEYDAAMLVGMSEKEYSDYMKDKTAVAKGTDFVYRNIRYQVKANRPSGKKGSKVTMVPKYPDVLIYIGRSFVNPKELCESQGTNYRGVSSMMMMSKSYLKTISITKIHQFLFISK